MKKLFEFILNLFKRKNKSVIRYEFPIYTIKDSDISLFNEINQHRLSLGLNTLNYGFDESLDIVGDHAKFLSDRVSNKEDFKKIGHWYVNHRFQQIQLRDKNIKYLGECLSYGYVNPKSVVSSWVKSEGHREILEGDFTHVAIGSDKKINVVIFYRDGN